MSLWFSIAVFFSCLILSLISSLVLVSNLDKVGARLGLSEALIGILTALGADAPEIAAAVTALLTGQHDLGLGVVLGSNIFNLAALLGLGALISGQIIVGREGLLLNGAAALLVTLIAGGLVLGTLSPAWGMALVVLALTPYLLTAALKPAQAERLRLPGPINRFVVAAATEVDHDCRKDVTAARATGMDALTVIPALVSVILASVGMVNSASSVGARWGVSPVVTGTLVLASLTGIPNVVAAIRLAVRQRGSALVSESFNSNTINLTAGVFIPSLIFGMSVPSGLTLFSVWWLLGMTMLALVLSLFRGGLSRAGGGALIGLYAIFAIIIVRWH